MKLSLLMTNYNCAKHIKQAIESVIDQSSPDWELIIVDDASTDNSIEIIKKFLNYKIKLIKHKENKGYASSLLTAINAATGEIIARLDADDALDKDAVKIMLQEHESDYGFIYSTYLSCDSDLIGQKIASWVKPQENTAIKGCTISHFATFKRSAYNKTSGFDPTQKKAVDKDIYYKLEEVTKLKFIDKPLYLYRQNPKGISQGKNESLALIYDIIAIYKAYKRRLNTNIPNLTKEEIKKKLKKAITLSKDNPIKETLKKYLAELNN